MTSRLLGWFLFLVTLVIQNDAKTVTLQVAASGARTVNLVVDRKKDRPP